MSTRVDSAGRAVLSRTGATSVQLRELGWLPVALFAIASATAAGFIFYVGRGTFLHADDWSMVVGNWDVLPSTLLAPHVDHLIAVQVAIFELVRAFAGWHYGAYRVVMIVIHLGVCACVFEFARRRIGGWPALALVLPLLFLGAGADAVLWPAIMGNDVSMLAGIAAWLVLEGGGHRRRRGVLACLLLVVAIASFSYGVVFAVLTGIWLLGTGRRRRVWVAVIPLVLYAAWQIAYPSTPITLENIIHTPAFVFESAAVELGALTGLGLDPWGRVLVVVAAIVLVLELRRPSRRPLETLIVVALPFLLWIQTGVGRAAGGVTLQALQPRYIYPGVVAVLLAIAQLLRGRRLTRAFLSVAGILLAAGVAHNIKEFRDAGAEFRVWAGQARAYIGAVELAHPAVSPSFSYTDFSDPGAVGNTIGLLEVGSYDAAARKIGSEPVDLNALSTFTPGELGIVDDVLVKALRLRVSALPTSRQARSASTCRRESALAFNAGIPVMAPGLTLRTDTRATVYVRRYAATFSPTTVGSTAPNRASEIAIPRDRGSRQWYLRAVGGGAGVVCIKGA